MARRLVRRKPAPVRSPTNPVVPPAPALTPGPVLSSIRIPYHLPPQVAINLSQNEELMADKSPINMNPETMTPQDRARLAARRAAEALLPAYGTEAAKTVKTFTPRRTPDAFAIANAVVTVWRQVSYFSPKGDSEDLFPVYARFDRQGRLHCMDGPAIEFSDGFKVYFVKGIEVGEYAIHNPTAIPVEMIRDCKNIEQRRILIECYGRERYIEALKLKPIHKDDWGELYRAEIPNDEPLCMVKVVNSTPEPDGTYKDYWLCVPPSITTARAAVAWTFQKTEETYNPKIQT